MRCPKGETISAYIDGELDLRRAAAVRSHIAECNSCARLAGELKAARFVLVSQPRPIPRAGFTERTLGRHGSDAARTARPGFAPRRLAPWVGAALVLVSLGAGLMLGRWRKPNDPLIARCLEYYEESASHEPTQSALDDSSPWTAVLGEGVR